MRTSASTPQTAGVANTGKPSMGCESRSIPAATSTSGSQLQISATTRPMWPQQPEMIIFRMAAPYSRPALVIAWRRTSRFFSEISHRGRRRGPASWPSRFMAALMGMGFTSVNRASIRSMYRI